MLFNSHIFIFIFLPVTLLGFFALARFASKDAARVWMLLASLVFYGWWSFPYLILLVLWIAANYAVGQEITAQQAKGGVAQSRPWAIAAIALNLFGLGYFKYATFVMGNVGALTGLDFAVEAVILPLAISFHVFQQIAYIADLQRGQNPHYSLFDYMLFVSFFPQLIAGPIVHHYELLPQFQRDETYKPKQSFFVVGIAFFVIGLVKKLVLADPMSSLSAPAFAAAASGQPGLLEAWIGVVSFSLGLYFDFSAYSDMAIGLARMLGLQLPYNFNSPYKSTSIIDFWRRWHMTLSRFLRDYLYIPLGGNRKGPARRNVNLMITMLLGGLWHGASWTFVVWGGLHGFYLLINHAFNHWIEAGEAARKRFQPGPLAAQALTLFAVALAWTFFAAPNFDSALSMVRGMLGFGGLVQPETVEAFSQSAVGALLFGGEGSGGWLNIVQTAPSYIALGIGLVVVLLAPNSQQYIDGRMSDVEESIVKYRLSFTPNVRTALTIGAGFLVSLMLLADVKEFVYFQF